MPRQLTPGSIDRIRAVWTEQSGVIGTVHTDIATGAAWLLCPLWNGPTRLSRHQGRCPGRAQYWEITRVALPGVASPNEKTALEALPRWSEPPTQHQRAARGCLPIQADR